MAVWSMFAKKAFHKTVSVTKSFIHDPRVCTPVYLLGPSMLPTIQSGDFAISERISIMFGKVERGDIVMSRSPEDPGKFITKRVKGMEGDEVTYTPKNSYRRVTIVVPKGHVWLAGDNESNSRDSRTFGAVPYGLVEGRICWRFWPPERFGPLEQKAKQMNQS